jgi:phospholipid/cholesterol/gamma-HCH transport system permease protein
MKSFLQPILNMLENMGHTAILFWRTLLYIPYLPRQWRSFIDQCFQIGYKTLPIVSILSIFIGAVLALQAGFSLSKFPGAQSYLGSIVGLSMCRELGPVMTAFLLAGRVGSAITAELASMTVYSEVDALVTMNIPPERFLVMPRLMAAMAMMPTLTICSVIFGWFGGMLVAQYVSFIQLDSQIYWRNLKEFVDFKSIMDGLIKAEVFAILVAIICCGIGLRTRGGPREIGFSVTQAVVKSMIFILLLDYFITKILL